MLSRLLSDRRRLFHVVILFGFICGSLGGAWDASYHFKYLRDLYQLPHILNATGHLIVLVALCVQYRRETPQMRKTLRVMFAGFIVFALAIGFDQWWHVMFGIDLTIWSPAHLSLYTGSLIIIVGATLAMLEDGHASPRFRRAMLLAYLFLILESFWFPLIQQEQGVIVQYYLDRNIYTFIHHDLFLEFFRTPHSVYGGIPAVVYGAWAAGSLMLVLTLAKKMKLHFWSASIVAGLYLVIRIVTNAVFVLVAYPASTVPYFVLPVAFCFDAAFALAAGYGRVRAFLTAAVVIVGVNVVAFVETPFPVHPPMPVETWAYSVPAVLLGYLLAELSLVTLFKGHEKKGIVHDMVRYGMNGYAGTVRYAKQQYVWGRTKFGAWWN